MRFDVAIAGGGLHAGLCALAILHRRPTARICLIEQQDTLGGNHTWACHALDVPPAAALWFEPLVVRRWPGFDLHFSGESQRLALPYAATTGDRLHDVVQQVLQRSGCELRVATRVQAVATDHIELTSGEEIAADLVLDGRGAGALSLHGTIGWQKFVGLRVRTQRAHQLDQPILMDARQPQRGALRFAYVLPWQANELLVETTVFSDQAQLDASDLRQGCTDWLRDNGHPDAELVGEQQGVLPMPCQVAAVVQPVGVLRIGMAGGWLNAATGYTLPIGVRVAQWLAERSPTQARQQWPQLQAAHAHKQQFACLLNRLLFEHTPPDQRHHALRRFHRLDSGLIARFYAMQWTAADRARLFSWPPPQGVRVMAALAEVADYLGRRALR